MDISNAVDKRLLLQSKKYSQSLPYNGHLVNLCIASVLVKEDVGILNKKKNIHEALPRNNSI